jgi:hypothetical protein
MEDLTLERWRRQSAMTDPADAAALLRDIPDDAERLCELTQGVLLHSDWLGAYGLSATQFATISRDTIPFSQRLKMIAGAPPLAIEQARKACDREVGTCRDYAQRTFPRQCSSRQARRGVSAEMGAQTARSLAM